MADISDKIKSKQIIQSSKGLVQLISNEILKDSTEFAIIQNEERVSNERIATIFKVDRQNESLKTVYGYVHLDTGDLYKNTAAGTPAKKASGSVLSEDSGLSVCTVDGIK